MITRRRAALLLLAGALTAAQAKSKKSTEQDLPPAQEQAGGEAEHLADSPATEDSPAAAPSIAETEFGMAELAQAEAEIPDGEPDGTEDAADALPLHDIPGMDHELTQKFRDYFLTVRGRKLLVTSLENSVPYRPYIVQQLTEKELPLYLQYLPIVESNYVPSAISRSGATGIWQFMENSMRPYLTKDAWYDDRRDPWLSTDAALAKLSDNYRTFGDWALALAAYNCGAGALSRVVKAHPDKDYWYLAENGLLKAQTAQYVPKLLAIADIIENADYYDAPEVREAALLIDGAEPEEFDYVTTVGMLSFNQIAEVTGIEKTRIKTLNQALFRNCTPAGQAYKLRLPAGTGEGVEEKLKEQGIATDALIYTVVAGDTLWGISRRYKITVADLCAVNGIKENGILSIGKKLIVPIFN